MSGAVSADTVHPPRTLELQPRALRTLRQALAGSGHAYVLAGEPGAGAVDAARWLAAAAVCPNGGGDGCEACARALRGVHPDVHWLRAEGTELAIEQIRDLVDQLVRTPFEALRQVAVIEDADTLGSTNAAAGNALLKVLEEPPGEVLFILLARRVAQVLPTLRSRAIEVGFPPLPDATLRAELEACGVSDATLAERGLDLASLVRAARGDLGRAHELAAGGPALATRQLALQVAEGLATGTIQPSACADALAAHVEAARGAAEAAAGAEFEAIAERMAPKDASRFRNSRDTDGMEKRSKRRGRRAAADTLRALLDELAVWHRDLLAVRLGAQDAVLSRDRIAQLSALRAAPASERAVAALDAIEELQSRASGNVDLPIALAALCSELASLAEHRVRSRRTLGASARSPQGYELALG